MLDRHYNFLLPLFIITGILSAEDTELPLRAAIASALAHNLDLRIATYAPANALDSVAIDCSLELSLAHRYHDLRGYGLVQRRIKVAHNDWWGLQFEPGGKDEFRNLFGFQSLILGKGRGAC